MTDFQNIPYGLCQCGCGRKTKVSPMSRRERNWTKGEPRRFLHGHNNRSAVLEYTEDPDSGCWIWQRSLTTAGYARVFRAGKTRAGHREIYEFHIGPIPDGLDLDHLCRVRACVNPGHLEPVTRAENIRRANGKLTREGIEEIRASRGLVTQTFLASKFGVAQTSISAVQRGLTWRDLD